MQTIDTPTQTSLSHKLYEKAKTLTPSGVHSPVWAFQSVGGHPFYIERGDGAILTSVDGDQYIDFVNGWGAIIHGHNHPKIRAAVHEASSKGNTFGAVSPYQIPLCELVVEAVPSIEKVRMCNSGTEATMSAIRLARGFTGRNKIIKFSGCYHGHLDALLVKAGSGPLTFGNPDSAGIPPAFANETLLLEYNDIDAIKGALQAYGSEIAAIILEPYIGNCGHILAKPGYLQALRQLCTEHGVLLIFDEVMTGFRQALGGVQEKEGITPDITCLSKIIGGGLPVGAFGGRAEIMEMLSPAGPVYQAGTNSGNPVTMASGTAALQLIKEEPPYALLEQMCQQLRSALLEAANKKGLALQVPQSVGMLSCFFSETPVHNYNEAIQTETSLFNKLFHFALERGVYLPPSAFEAWFLTTAHHGAALDKACEVLSEGIKHL
tara:strand:+ start:11448 stop:12752 length:1305 start_codon:yes stop_codon:yes gene_type:complete